MTPIALPRRTLATDLRDLAVLAGGVIGTSIFFVAVGAWSVCLLSLLS